MHLCTRAPDTAVTACPAELFQVLSVPLPWSMAVLVPAADGRDVLPHARWGRIALPGTDILWNAADADAFAAMGRLRRRGSQERVLVEVAPPMDVHGRLPMREWERTYSAWAFVYPWRRVSAPQWHIAVHATSHVTQRPRRKRAANSDEGTHSRPYLRSRDDCTRRRLVPGRVRR